MAFRNKHSRTREPFPFTIYIQRKKKKTYTASQQNVLCLYTESQSNMAQMGNIISAQRIEKLEHYTFSGVAFCIYKYYILHTYIYICKILNVKSFKNFII
jgi:hypothetical protein